MAKVTMEQWLNTVPEDLLDDLESLPASTVDILMGLNPQQLKAALSVDGTIQVDATAGSGKTSVATKRIRVMLDKGVKPGSILFTTFTKKATEEMTARLSKLIPKLSLAQITLGTTHSIGYRILAKEYANMNHHLARAFKNKLLMNGELKIFMDQIKKSIMMDRSVQYQVKEEIRDLPLAQFGKVISSSMNEGRDAQDFSREYAGKGTRMEAYAEFFQRYEAKKWAECRVDADDLLFLLDRLFEEHPAILKKYQKVYKYVIVDEAQDCNALQWKLMKAIAHPENNLLVVGDCDQAMYSFRGAKPEEFIHLADTFRHVKRIPLEWNYRSRPRILDTANKLIANNTERLDKKLKPYNQDQTECVFYSHYQDEMEEAQHVAQEVETLVSQEGFSYKQVAVLYRTNAQSRALEDALIMAGLPYVIHGGISFYERKEVKDILAYLSLIIDKSDDQALQRVINVPSRYLGKAFLEKVKAYKGSNWDALDSIALKDYERHGVSDFKDLMDTLDAYYESGKTPMELVDSILLDGKYEAYLKDDGDTEDEGNSRMENIATLKHVLSRYEKVEDFLAYIRMMTSQAKHSIDGVQCMSIHKSKGLEFPVVFVVGVSDGLLPHYKSIEAYEEGNELAIEEERRLMYVASTRAESLCYISSASTFNGRGCGASRFIPEMGLKLREVNKEEIGAE